MLPSDLPRHIAAEHRRGKLLAQPLFDYWLPRHQGETHADSEHCVASTAEHDAAPLDADHALPVGYRPYTWPRLCTKSRETQLAHFRS